ncbi:MAG: 2-succinyl-5-enolpyruvyl-6-hydroxy-3-cyclohexene-1-carboxylic-acid synthase [Burkholderiales bacterium]|nr:2-succinyl-5-enolpyruvyl-6-hydroxy-3-cyclohexene-1-carboxylic-acid synthase [Burkholderiales bacterium]
MTARSDDLHSAWSHLFAAALAQCGVRRAVISPGSRSTPLALALAAHLPTTLLHDERAAAFYALGQARTGGGVSVVLATSGSAPGHWLPAAIEARESGLPLLLLSADRPWDVQQAQASQTVDQVRLFGVHANAYFELGLPDEHPAALRAVPRIAAQAVLATRHPLSGAVQVNAHFRKPLEPRPSDGREPWRADLEAVAAAGAPRIVAPRAMPDAAAVAALVEAVRAAPQGLIVAGPMNASGARGDAAALRAAVMRFVAASGYALLAEATSQLRFGAAAACRIGAFDALLCAPELRRRLAPALALEIGAPAVSAQWLDWISGSDAPPRIVLPGLRPADPAGGARAMLLAPVAALLDAAAVVLEAGAPDAAALAAGADYRRRWHGAEAAAWVARSQAIAANAAGAALQEHEIAPLLRAALPADALLMVGNSSPVRDLDHDLPPDERPLTLLHQRGAAGIDGLVAGAAGARSVIDAARPLALLIGDVSLLHDAGGLAAVAAQRGPLAIVVVHNDGGRIFERLPLGADAGVASGVQDARERLFVAPHGRAFDGLASTWGIAYERASTAAELAQALAHALASDRPCLIEARVAPGGSARRAALLAAMAAAGAAAGAAAVAADRR